MIKLKYNGHANISLTKDNVTTVSYTHLIQTLHILIVAIVITIMI